MKTNKTFDIILLLHNFRVCDKNNHQCQGDSGINQLET